MTLNLKTSPPSNDIHHEIAIHVQSSQYDQILADLSSFISSLIPLSSFALAEDARSNILWISCEDISPNLGCYGDKHAITPNLDRLAKEEGKIPKSIHTGGGLCRRSKLSHHGQVCTVDRLSAYASDHSSTFGEGICRHLSSWLLHDKP